MSVEGKTAASDTVRDVDRYSMADPEVARCPLGYYAAMRAEAPVHRAPRYRFLPGGEERVGDGRCDGRSNPVVAQRTDRQTATAAGMEMLDTLVTGDPPEREHYRALGMSLFNPKKVEELTPYIQGRVNELIDASRTS